MPGVPYRQGGCSRRTKVRPIGIALNRMSAESHLSAVIFVWQPTAPKWDRLYPDSTRTKKNVTPLESTHRHHRPARAASARAARGRCFDPTRGATAPGCQACSTSREHRVGSLVGQDQTQAHSNSSTSITVYELPARSRRQLIIAHIHRIVLPRCRSKTSWLRAGRVWACTRPLQSVYAVAELVCRR